MPPSLKFTIIRRRLHRYSSTQRMETTTDLKRVLIEPTFATVGGTIHSDRIIALVSGKAAADVLEEWIGRNRVLSLPHKALRRCASGWYATVEMIGRSRSAGA